MKGSTSCELCPRCPPGMGTYCSNHKVYPEKLPPKCSRCIKDTFSAYHGFERCLPCTPSIKGYVAIKECTTTSDRVFQCSRGKYEDSIYHQCIMNCCKCKTNASKIIQKCWDEEGKEKGCASHNMAGSCMDPMILPMSPPPPSETTRKKSMKQLVISITTRLSKLSTEYKNSTKLRRVNTHTKIISTTNKNKSNVLQKSIERVKPLLVLIIILSVLLVVFSTLGFYCLFMGHHPPQSTQFPEIHIEMLEFREDNYVEINTNTNDE